MALSRIALRQERDFGPNRGGACVCGGVVGGAGVWWVWGFGRGWWGSGDASTDGVNFYDVMLLVLRCKGWDASTYHKQLWK